MGSAVKCALIVLLAALAGCGSAEPLPEFAPPVTPKPPPSYGEQICVDIVNGHKVTYYCSERKL
jgi:predicted small lipoprotein YifL